MFAPKNIFLSIIVVVVGTSTAQTTDSLLIRMESIFKKALLLKDSSLNSATSLQKGVDLFYIPLVSMPDFKDSLLVSYFDDSNKNWGLSFRANGRYNGTGNPLEDEETVAQGRMLMRTGLHWDVLRSGMVDNKKSAQILSLDRELHQLETARENSRSTYGLRYQNILYEFYKKSERILANRLEFLKEQEEILYALYYNRQVYYEQILESKKKMAIVTNQLREVQSFCTGHKGSKEVLDYPIFEIDLEKVLEKMDSSNTAQRIIDLKYTKQQLLFQRSNLASFQLYAQVQAIQNLDKERRVTPALGFQFTMPLKKKVSKRSLDIEEEQIKQEVTDTKENQVKEVRVHYLGFMEKLKQWKRIHYQEEIIKERLLTKKILNTQLNPEIYISSFDLVDQLMELDYEAHQLQYQMYLYALGMAFFANIEDSEEFMKCLRPLIMDGLSHNMAAIWNIEKDMTVSPLLMGYLKRIKIQKIYLKGSKEHPNYTLLQHMLLSEGFQLMENYAEYQVYDPAAISKIISLAPQEGHAMKKYIIDDMHELMAFEKTRFNEKVQF